MTSFENKFEIKNTFKWITKNNFKKVALQFPEYLYQESTKICEILQNQLKTVEFAIVAEKKHSSCCLDEISSEHFGADCIVHYGNSCLSPSFIYPVLFVFEKKTVEFDDFNSKIIIRLKDFSTENIVFFYDLSYHHLRDDMIYCLKDHFKTFYCPNLASCDHFSVSSHTSNNLKSTPSCCSFSSLSSNSPQVADEKHTSCLKIQKKQKKNIISENIDSNEVTSIDGFFPKDERSTINMCSLFLGRIINRNLSIYHTETDFNFENKKKNNNNENIKNNQFEDFSLFYLGSDKKFLECLCLSFSNHNHLMHFDPTVSTLQIDHFNWKKLINRRYFLLEKCKDACFVGVIPQKPEAPHSLELLTKIREAAKSKNKKTRIFSPGVLNCAKLANIVDFELYVLVACPLSSLIDDKEFLQPIVTPFEFLYASSYLYDFSHKTSSNLMWQNYYTFNFSHLVKFILNEQKVPFSQVSLITGKIRNFSFENAQDNENNQISKQDNPLAVISVSSELLKKKSWKGLELNHGENEVSMATKGSDGTASQYEHEIN